MNNQGKPPTNNPKYGDLGHSGNPMEPQDNLGKWVLTVLCITRSTEARIGTGNPIGRRETTIKQKGQPRRRARGAGPTTAAAQQVATSIAHFNLNHKHTRLAGEVFLCQVACCRAPQTKQKKKAITSIVDSTPIHCYRSNSNRLDHFYFVFVFSRLVAVDVFVVDFGVHSCK